MITYRFIQPLPNGLIEQVSIEAASLQDAIIEYVDHQWDPDLEAAVVVYNGNFIVGQVLPRYSQAQGDMEAVFEPF